MKALIINNLASGYRDGSIYDFVRSFTEDGDEVCMRSTDGTTSIDGLLDDASDFDVVVASGGDGTVTSVASCYEYWCAAFALPCWHANLLSLNLAQPNSSRTRWQSSLAVARRLTSMSPKSKPKAKSTASSTMAGAGYDATIMESAAPNKKFFWYCRVFLGRG